MSSQSEFSVSELPETAPATRSRRWIAIALLMAVIAGGLVWWFRPDGQAIERELAAKAELAKLGALVVMDAEPKHVSSVTLATLTSPELLDRAIALLPALPYIRSLNVSGAPFRDEHAETVGRLVTLEDLVLSNTTITDKALDELSGLAQLKTIHLVDTGVTNDGMPSVGLLCALKIVDISGTKVTGNLEPVCELSELNWLVVQRLSLDAAALESIGKCPSLSRLSLRETTCPVEALNQLRRTRPELTIDR